MTEKNLDLLSYIGNTPLVQINRLAKDFSPNIQIFAKLEWHNPSGSVKARAASRMILKGEETGKLTKDKIILDATSGNTGIAYAMIGARKGYRVKLIVPKNICHERKLMISTYGAELIFSDPLDGTDGAQRLCQKIYNENPSQYFYPDQYNNDENWRAHYETTGPEIWRQTNGEITHFVAGTGTSGTFMGTGRFLREKNSKIQLVCVQPDAPFHGLEGWKHMASAIRPGIYKEDLANSFIEVSTEEAYKTARALGREEGLFVGVSAGAAMTACLKLARTLTSAKIVTVFADGGDRYMNDLFWNDKD